MFFFEETKMAIKVSFLAQGVLRKRQQNHTVFTR